MSNELTAIEQRDVDFYGDELAAIRADDGKVYAPVRQMCNALGLAPDPQVRRIRRHAILSDGLKGVTNLVTPGGVQTAFVLRADLVPLWLSGIRTSAVSEEIRPKLERFQREAAAVLWEAFQDGRLTGDPFAELLETDSPEAQAYMMARAIMTMARNQLLLKSQVDTHGQRLDTHELRLETVEAALSNPDRLITEDQAMQVSQAVKAIALELGKRSGRNEFGGVYGELYRQYGISSYKQLPASKFDQAMNFLRQWYESLTDASAKF
jgi:hypothetical protein